MTDLATDWTAPQVTPLTEAEGASTSPAARVRNGSVVLISSTPV